MYICIIYYFISKRFILYTKNTVTFKSIVLYFLYSLCFSKFTFLLCCADFHVSTKIGTMVSSVRLDSLIKDSKTSLRYTTINRGPSAVTCGTPI